MAEVRMIAPNGAADRLYYYLGGLILFLNKIRHGIQGYTQPRPFPNSQIRRAIAYDFEVVRLWTQHLVEYISPAATLEGKTILELGPGADLGTGILTLVCGAKKYNAIDVHNLIEATPQQFYQELLNHIEDNVKDAKVDVDYLRRQLELTLRGQGDKIRYVHDKNFDVSVFEDEGIDLVVSQAAFEHFDNVEDVVMRLSKVVKAGAVLVAEVDLRTHTRWIRDADPLNIYRYEDSLYDALRFRGSPNRLRPFEYEQILKENGWGNIRIEPMEILDKNYILKTQCKLAGRFQDQKNGMDQLIIAVCATKG